MLPLPELRPGDAQKNSARQGKDRQPIPEQRPGPLQEAGAPPGGTEHAGREKGERDALRVHPEPVRERGRKGREPDDQRRIDLHEIDVEPLSSDPLLSDVEQPGDVVLERRTKVCEQHEAERDQKGDEAENRQRMADGDNGTSR